MFLESSNLYDVNSRTLKEILKNSVQKQPSRGVLRKRCYENMQQICDLIEITLRHGYIHSCKFAACFQNTFSLKTPLGGCFWVLLKSSLALSSSIHLWNGFCFVNTSYVLNILHTMLDATQMFSTWAELAETDSEQFQRTVSETTFLNGEDGDSQNHSNVEKII